MQVKQTGDDGYDYAACVEPGHGEGCWTRKPKTASGETWGYHDPFLGVDVKDVVRDGITGTSGIGRYGQCNRLQIIRMRLGDGNYYIGGPETRLERWKMGGTLTARNGRIWE